MVTLPEKIANLPASEIHDIINDPSKYNLTIGDLILLGRAAAEAQPKSDDDDKYKVQCELLSDEIRELKARIRKLESALSVFIKGEDEDDYD